MVSAADMAEAVDAIDALVHCKEPINLKSFRWQATHRHVKTGGLYKEILRAIDEPTLEMAVIYMGEDGVVWVRSAAQFDDPARFEPLIEGKK